MSTIRKGTLLLLSRGEYSDYDVTAVCRATQDFDPDALKREWLDAHPDQDEQYRADLSAFLAWLLNVKAIAEELEVTELHLGSYSTLDPYVRREPK